MPSNHSGIVPDVSEFSMDSALASSAATSVVNIFATRLSSDLIRSEGSEVL